MTVKVALNHAAFRELMNSPEVRDDLKRRAEKVADAAGDGYEVLMNERRRGRAGVTVAPGTSAARRVEARDHKLLSALDAGRG